MKAKYSGAQIEYPKDLEVNTDVKVIVRIIHPWVSPETFGTPNIDSDVLSSPISITFALLDQQIANFEWTDSDSSFWIKKDGWSI